MIEISITTAAALYSLVLLAGMFAVWVYTEVSIQRTQTALSKQNVWRCTYCAFSYLDEEAITLSECPRCGSINAANGGRVPVNPEPGVPPVDDEESGIAPRRNPSHRKRPGAQTRGPRRRS